MHSKFFCCIIIRCRSQFSLLSIITLNCSSFRSDKSFFRNCFDFVSAIFLLLFKLQMYFSATWAIIVKNNIVDAEEFEQKNVRTFKKTFLQIFIYKDQLFGFWQQPSLLGKMFGIIRKSFRQLCSNFGTLSQSFPLAFNKEALLLFAN